MTRFIAIVVLVASALIVTTMPGQQTQSKSMGQAPAIEEWTPAHAPVSWPPNSVVIKQLEKDSYSIVATWNKFGKLNKPGALTLPMLAMVVGPPDTCPSWCSYFRVLALTGPPDTVMVEAELRTDIVMVSGPPDTVALESVNKSAIQLIAKWNAPKNPGKPIRLRHTYRISTMLAPEGCPPWCPPRLNMSFSRIASTDKSKLPVKGK